MELFDVMGSGNIHRCREIQPFEATIYGLQSDNLEKFAAISTAELTLSVKKEKKKKLFTSLELPVDFSRESLAVASV